MRLTHASVFSGIGGPEIAATMLGWENVFHCEINPFGKAVLDYWYPNSKSYEDITKTDFSEWQGRVDVLTGGFPCQPFSYAGQRRGAEDDRYLWPEFKRVIAEVRPTWIVGENVAGITTMVEPGKVIPMESQATLFDEGDGVHRYRHEQPFTIERICKDLEELGYAVQPLLIPACAVGAPHRRDRVFIIATNTESDGGSGITRSESETASRQDGQFNAEPILNGCVSQRPAADTIPQDSMHSRQLYGQDEVEGSERNIGNVGAGGGERICSGTSGTNDVADTKSQQGERHEPQQPRPRRTAQGELGGGNSKDSGVAGCGRWDDFPSVPAVHRGNDGLPLRMDRAAIPFAKWRNEALKAYGNAIVPQVMYEIFRAIEIVEREKL